MGEVEYNYDNKEISKVILFIKKWELSVKDK